MDKQEESVLKNKYKQSGLSESGAKLQVLLCKHLLSRGVILKPGVCYFIGSNDENK